MPRLTRPLPDRALMYSCLEAFSISGSSAARVDDIRRVFDYYSEPDASRRQNCFACYPHTNLAGEIDGCCVTFITADGTYTYLLPLLAVSLIYDEYLMSFATFYIDDTLVSLYRDAVDLQGRRPANAKRHQ